MTTQTLRTEPHDEQPAKRRVELFVGATLLTLGTVLLAVAVGYQVYGRFARSNLDELSFTIERPQFAGHGYGVPAPAGSAAGVTTAPQADATAAAPKDNAQSAAASERQTADGSAPASSAGGEDAVSASTDGPAKDGAVDPAGAPDGSATAKAAQTTSAGTSAGGPTSDSSSSDTTVASSRTSVATDPTTSVAAQPPDEVPQHATYDTGPPSDGVARPAEPDPRLAAIAASIEASIAELATYSAPTTEDLTSPGALATRIRIPAIGVDAVIDELRILKLDDSLTWETPNKIVGHIPTTASAGSAGQGWYFGHLESPIRGEGNIFAKLPEIPELASDAPIYIFLETADRHYAYQVYVTDVVYEDDLSLTNSGKHDITLVTCTPRFYYDHRLLVTAALVGVKEA